MTNAELLRANGNRWRVLIYDGRNRELRDVVFVRAPSRERAERLALQVSVVRGGRFADAKPYDPRRGEMWRRGLIRYVT